MIKLGKRLGRIPCIVCTQSIPTCTEGSCAPGTACVAVPQSCYTCSVLQCIPYALAESPSVTNSSSNVSTVPPASQTTPLFNFAEKATGFKSTLSVNATETDYATASSNASATSGLEFYPSATETEAYLVTASPSEEYNVTSTEEYYMATSSEEYNATSTDEFYSLSAPTSEDYIATDGSYSLSASSSEEYSATSTKKPSPLSESTSEVYIATSTEGASLVTASGTESESSIETSSKVVYPSVVSTSEDYTVTSTQAPSPVYATSVKETYSSSASQAGGYNATSNVEFYQAPASTVVNYPTNSTKSTDAYTSMSPLGDDITETATATGTGTDSIPPTVSIILIPGRIDSETYTASSDVSSEAPVATAVASFSRAASLGFDTLIDNVASSTVSAVPASSEAASLGFDTLVDIIVSSAPSAAVSTAASLSASSQAASLAFDTLVDVIASSTIPLEISVAPFNLPASTDLASASITASLDTPSSTDIYATVSVGASTSYYSQVDSQAGVESYFTVASDAVATASFAVSASHGFDTLVDQVASSVLPAPTTTVPLNFTSADSLASTATYTTKGTNSAEIYKDSAVMTKEKYIIFDQPSFQPLTHRRISGTESLTESASATPNVNHTESGSMESYGTYIATAATDSELYSSASCVVCPPGPPPCFLFCVGGKKCGVTKRTCKTCPKATCVPV
jgi:hypothetical protein